MKFQSLPAVTLFVVCAFAAVTPAQASFVGDDVSVNYEWPNLGTVLYSGGSSIVAAGGTIFNMSSGGVLADVTNSNILLTFPGGWSFSTAAKSFDGVVVTDPSAAITGVSLASTNIAGFVASDLSFDGNNVYINFPFPPFSSLNAGASVSVDVQFASPVPEPTTLYVTIAFLLVFLVCRRRRWTV